MLKHGALLLATANNSDSYDETNEWSKQSIYI